MRFNFHKYMHFKECPKKFKLHEDGVPLPEGKNEYFTLFGNLIQKFFELYSNEWKSQGIYFSEHEIRDRLQPLWEKILLYSEVDWNAPFARLNSREIFDSAVECAISNLDMLDVYENVRSEVKIEVTFRSGDVLVGKIDFIDLKEGTPPEEAIILDGKSTDKVGKNIHVEQLYTYAILYKFKYGVYPKRIGILYFRMQQIEYYDMDLEAIENFKKELILTMFLIRNKKEFEATPSAKSCKYCEYFSVCEEGIASANKRKRVKKDLGIKKTGSPVHFGF